jgi:D-alanine-D-alanine ligase
MSKPHVVVLMGGPDAERDVSILSGTAVAEALLKNQALYTTLETIETPSLEELIDLQADVIFPVLHGPYGEGGPLQQVLERTSLPFVGSGSVAAALAMNKVESKKIVQNLGIPTPPWVVINENTCELQPPLVLKPIEEGSSIDIVICNNEHDLKESLQLLLQHRKTLLAEKYIAGREITIGVLDGKPLPTIEIIPSEGNYDYAAKYELNDTKYILNPSLPDQKCAAWAIEIVKEMNIKDLARVDFIVNEDGPWFLEVNTMPGFTEHSLFPMAASHINIDMTTLCTRLVEVAVQDFSQ